jgi:phage-related protein
MAGGIFFNLISKFDDKGVKQAQGAFGGMTTSLGKLGAAIGTAFSVVAIKNFAKESITAAEGVAIANARIDQIAKSMGIFGEQTQAVADRLKAYAEANELTVGVDAEVIKATQAKLLTFKQLALTADDAGGAFDRATKAALDLAAAGFGTAESNAVQLGKALQDPIKGISALRRAGITFTEEEKKKIAALVESGKLLEAQNMVLQAIETQVGGTAAATATASAKMKLAFDNIKESIGAGLMPAFAALTEALLPIIEDLAPVLGEMIAKATPSFTRLAETIPVLIEALIPLVPIFLDILALVAELATDVIPILVEIFEAFVPVIEELAPIFLNLLRDILRPLAPVVLQLVAELTPLVQAILPLLVELIEKLLPPMLILLEELFIPLIPIVVDLVEAFLPLITTVLPILADILTNLVIPVFVTVVDFFKNILIGAIGIFRGAVVGLSAFIQGFADTFNAVWEGIKSVVSGVVTFVGSAISSMVSGATNAINSVISLANKALSLIKQVTAGTIDIKIPTIPTIAPPPTKAPVAPTPVKKIVPVVAPVKTIKIPKLAEGGIVLPQPGGVFANLAEGGQAEAVVPLNKLEGLGKQSTYNITINAGVGSDPVSIGRYVTDAIKRYESVSGKVFASA